MVLPLQRTPTATYYHTPGITGEITKLLSDLNTHDIKNLSDRGKKIRSLIYNAKFSR